MVFPISPCAFKKCKKKGKKPKKVKSMPPGRRVFGYWSNCKFVHGR